MKDGACPKCGESEVYLSSTETHGIHISLSAFTFTDLYVCAKCGYLEFYVQHKEDLEKVPKRFKKVRVKGNL